MTKPVERELRLQRLRVGVKLMFAVALLAVVWVMVSTGGSSTPAERALPALKVDISDILPGQARIVLWAERPVIILHRSQDQIESLTPADGRLRDPESLASTQPDFAFNDYRSARPDWFVAIALGTDLNCTVNLLPASTQPVLGDVWLGGFKDSCRGSFYDIAGRVFDDQYATGNLDIPEYSLMASGLETTLILGANSDQ